MTPISLPTPVQQPAVTYPYLQLDLYSLRLLSNGQTVATATVSPYRLLPDGKTETAKPLSLQDTMEKLLRDHADLAPLIAAARQATFDLVIEVGKKKKMW